MVDSSSCSSPHSPTCDTTDQSGGARARVHGPASNKGPVRHWPPKVVSAACPFVVVLVEQPGRLPDDEDLRRLFNLTPRESEVARLMAHRLSNGEIALKLGISIHTTRRHSESILLKLRIHTRRHVGTALLDRCQDSTRCYARSVA